MWDSLVGAWEFLVVAYGIWFPDRDQTLGLLNWEHGVLAHWNPVAIFLLSSILCTLQTSVGLFNLDMYFSILRSSYISLIIVSSLYNLFSKKFLIVRY